MTEKINNPEDASLEEFVSSQEYVPIQFLPEWEKVIETVYKNCSSFPDFVLEGKEIKSIFPFFLIRSKLFGNRIISQPFVDFGGPIGNSEKENLSDTIKKTKEKLGKECKRIEIRLNEFSPNYGETESILIEHGFEKKTGKQQVILNLLNESEDSFWNKLDRDARKGVNKSNSNNFKVVEIDGLDEVKAFYKLYFKSMKKFGTPQHSLKFFSKLLENKLLGGFNCYIGDELAASLILLLGKNYAYVAFNLTSWDHQKLRPNDTLYWETIKWTIGNKITYLDLGQVEKAAEENSHAAGIYNFKKKWGGKIYERPYFYYPHSPEKGDMDKERYSFLIKIWKHTPNFILKIIGPKIASQLAL